MIEVSHIWQVKVHWQQSENRIAIIRCQSTVKDTNASWRVSCRIYFCLRSSAVFGEHTCHCHRHILR